MNNATRIRARAYSISRAVARLGAAVWPGASRNWRTRAAAWRQIKLAAQLGRRDADVVEAGGGAHGAQGDTAVFERVVRLAEHHRAVEVGADGGADGLDLQVVPDAAGPLIELGLHEVGAAVGVAAQPDLAVVAADSDQVEILSVLHAHAQAG